MPTRYHQGILVSCEIPWDERGNLIEDIFRREIRTFLARGYKDVYIFGTAGEGYAVDTSQFQQIVRIFRQETNAVGVFPQVGAIDLSVPRIVERLRFAHDQGFRMFQISLPSWGTLNDAELMTFFRDVCSAFPDSKFLHYNTAHSGRVLTGADYRHIVDEIPNLVATKITTTRVPDAGELMKAAPELQHFFGELLYPVACLYGECSLLASFGPMFPSRTKQLFEYGQTAQFDELFCFFKKYLDVIDDVFSPVKDTTLMDGAVDKLVVRFSGIDFPIRLLSPYEGCPEATSEACRKILEEKYAGWMG